MNDALCKAYNSLVHEVEILKDVELAKASVDSWTGIEIEGETGVGAVEVEGVLMHRRLFFGRTNTIVDLDHFSGFNKTRHTLDKIAYMLMGSLHFSIL